MIGNEMFSGFSNASLYCCFVSFKEKLNKCMIACNRRLAWLDKIRYLAKYWRCTLNGKQYWFSSGHHRCVSCWQSVVFSVRTDDTSLSDPQTEDTK